ncbi:unnamed protein product [Colias eurytheme]|nr:unnamed protein product [Colias eurytheme]
MRRYQQSDTFDKSSPRESGRQPLPALHSLSGIEPAAIDLRALTPHNSATCDNRYIFTILSHGSLAGPPRLRSALHPPPRRTTSHILRLPKNILDI